MWFFPLVLYRFQAHQYFIAHVGSARRLFEPWRRHFFVSVLVFPRRLQHASRTNVSNAIATDVINVFINAFRVFISILFRFIAIYLVIYLCYLYTVSIYLMMLCMSVWNWWLFWWALLAVESHRNTKDKHCLPECTAWTPPRPCPSPYPIHSVTLYLSVRPGCCCFRGISFSQMSLRTALKNAKAKACLNVVKTMSNDINGHIGCV